MKFAEHLSAHITPEWRKQYITYESMKEMLYSAIEQLPNDTQEVDDTNETIDSIDDDNDVNQCLKQFEEQFFTYCEEELSKINTFFAEKLAEAIRKFGDLKAELLASQHLRKQNGHNKYDKLFGLIERNLINESADRYDLHRKVSRKLHDLKLAFSEFYLSLVLLQNYQNLNFTGFRKILKKHDKLMNTNSGLEWRQNNVETSQFYTNNEVNRLILETENLFTTHLESGDRQRAMKRLRVPPLNAHQSVWTTFRVGLFLGAFFVLLLNVILVSVFLEHDIEWSVALRLFRGPLLIIIFLFMIGINVYGWRTSGVNHVLIFELDPRDHLSEQHFFEIGSIFAVLWSLSVLAYLFSPNFLQINANLFPLLLVFSMLLFLINPTRTLKHNARFWLLKVLVRVIRAPFVKVEFADFWLADQLNSIVPILQDFEFMVCFYLNFYSFSHRKFENTTECCVSATTSDLLIRTFVACLPAWFRFAQCLRRYKDDRRGLFPHVVNAGKYSTTFFVVIFSTLTKITMNNYDHSFSNPFFNCWIISMIVSSCYTYIWDIKMDWGLFDPKSPNKEFPFLREEIVYSSPNYYYFAIIEDLILRFGWTLSVSLSEVGILHADIVVSILAPLELFRRFVWNFFRLENEHLNNCGEFRAVRDISIAPIENSRDKPDINEKIKSNITFKYRKPKTKTKLVLLKNNDSKSGQFLKVKPNQSSASLSTNSSLSTTNRTNTDVNLLIDDNYEINRL